MHDCREIKESLRDLVFDEAEPEASARLLAEVERCADCREQYQTMKATLRLFDRAAEASLPEESFWPGYEARLRARLAQGEAVSLRRRLADLFAGFTLRPRVLVPLAAGVVLIVLAAGVWLSWQKNDRALTPGPIVQQTPPPRENPPLPEPSRSPVPEQKPVLETPQPKVAGVSGPRGGQRSGASKKQRPEPVESGLALARFEAPSLPFLTPATTRHFDQAQVLLRSFKNALPAADDAALDLSYEKRQARSLVYQNILLRRDAAAKGNLPVEEVLNELEPLLLDIANLSDSAAPAEVSLIKERMQRKAIIAVLQVYSAQPALVSFHRN
jgi:hypothetical protein